MLRQGLLWGVVLFISCSLVFMGGLIWIDNSWAIIPDDDPATSFDSSLLRDILDGGDDLDERDADGDGQIPVPGGKLVRGNGDQDDNRQEPLRIVYRPGALIVQNHSPVPAKMWTHRTLKSYLDFGHLKVMPNGDFKSSIFIACYTGGPCSLHGSPVLCGILKTAGFHQITSRAMFARVAKRQG